MSFFAITTFRCDVRKGVSLEAISKVEKGALITDIVLVSLAAIAAALVLVQSNGLINLPGPLSSLGSLGSQAAYVMLGAAGGAIVLDVVKLIVQQARHNKQLASTFDDASLVHPPYGDGIF